MKFDWWDFILHKIPEVTQTSLLDLNSLTEVFRDEPKHEGVLTFEIEDKRKLYQENLLRFPAPKFFVLYDSDRNEPIEKIMRSSDDFGDNLSSLELDS